MKKKILRVLEDLCIPYKEHEKIEFYEGLTFTNVIEIWMDSPQVDGVKKDKKAFIIEIDDQIIYKSPERCLSLIDTKEPKSIALAKLMYYLGCWGY